MINKKFKYVKVWTAIALLSISFIPSFAQNSESKNGMLILGSDDINILKARIEVGFKLYKSAPSFDYIIVSGGCAAHKSNICEATEMGDLLIEKGIPAVKIFREEKSKTTIENYCYSRMLTDDAGEKIINPGDKLYVVSNHWHAVPVAARFATFDQVQAVYHIEGAIVPKNSDKVNYSNIFDQSLDSDDYCRKALWPIVDASFGFKTKKNENRTIFHIVGEIGYKTKSTYPGQSKAQMLTAAFPALPENWGNDIDAAFFHSKENKIYLFKGAQYSRLNPVAGKVDPGYPASIGQLADRFPGSWQGRVIDAAFYYPDADNIFLFDKDECLRISAKSGKVIDGLPVKIKTYFENWPFKWSDGDIDAARYDEGEKALLLFRGNEFIKASLEDSKVISGSPQKIDLEWPEVMFGKK